MTAWRFISESSSFPKLFRVFHLKKSRWNICAPRITVWSSRLISGASLRQSSSDWTKIWRPHLSSSSSSSSRLLLPHRTNECLQYSGTNSYLKSILHCILFSCVYLFSFSFNLVPSLNTLISYHIVKDFQIAIQFSRVSYSSICSLTSLSAIRKSPLKIFD